MDGPATEAFVLDVLARLDAGAVRVWLDGGWGVDALLGVQTRPHADLDLILAHDDLPGLRRALDDFTGPTPGVLVDPRGREVDVHTVRFDPRGYGVFALPDGRRWPFPPSAFQGRGRVGGREVACLSAEAQVQCHGQGYVPREKDLRDMERLQQRFGVVLPVHLCRQATGS